MKKALLILSLLPFFLNAQDTVIKADKCLGCDRGIIVVNGQRLSLVASATADTMFFNQLLTTTIKDVYSYSCLVNAVLTDDQLMILDNKLTLIKTVDLRQLGIISPKQVALEGVHYAWIYDQYQDRLIRISIGQEVIKQSIDISFLGHSVKEMIFHNNNLYFLCDKGLFYIDNLYNINLEQKGGAVDFDFLDDRLVLLRQNKAWIEDTPIKTRGKILGLCGQVGDKLIIQTSDTSFVAIKP